ncbi:putative Myb/SANT-like domain-containing protein [Arabidopsis thaliana]
MVVILAWSDEQTRLYLQLRFDEKLKGNIRKHILNEAGRQSIIDKFYEVYGVRHQWKKFGSKFTTCKKQYEAFRKLTHNRTGLGYFANGSIDMFEDSWNERCKEWPGARKISQRIELWKLGGGETLVAMTTETEKKKGPPQILKTDKATKLAEKWVANMTRPTEDDPIETAQEERPHRLGLGAQVSRQTKRRPSDNPLDQKLEAKFAAGKRKNARLVAESAGSSKNVGDDSEDDDESESKSQAFGKKKKNTSTPH